MSRIGNKIINVPESVTVTITPSNHVTVKGPKGELAFQFNEILKIEQTGQEIKIARPNDEIFSRKIHGTTRALLSNMVVGVTTGFKKQLEIQGVGYRASLQGKQVVLSVGFSHDVKLDIPEGVVVEMPKNTDIIISGINKQIVGEFAANVRAVRKPEPYKGKGIRYNDEIVRRKVGKTAK